MNNSLKDSADIPVQKKTPVIFDDGKDCNDTSFIFQNTGGKELFELALQYFAGTSYLKRDVGKGEEYLNKSCKLGYEEAITVSLSKDREIALYIAALRRGNQNALKKLKTIHFISPKRIPENTWNQIIQIQEELKSGKKIIKKTAYPSESGTVVRIDERTAPVDEKNNDIWETVESVNQEKTENERQLDESSEFFEEIDITEIDEVPPVIPDINEIPENNPAEPGKDNFSLALKYYFGDENTQQNKTKAFELFTVSKEQGDEDAATILEKWASVGTVNLISAIRGNKKAQDNLKLWRSTAKWRLSSDEWEKFDRYFISTELAKPKAVPPQQTKLHKADESSLLKAWQSFKFTSSSNQSISAAVPKIKEESGTLDTAWASFKAESVIKNGESKILELPKSDDRTTSELQVQYESAEKIETEMADSDADDKVTPISEDELSESLSNETPESRIDSENEQSSASPVPLSSSFSEILSQNVNACDGENTVSENTEESLGITKVENPLNIGNGLNDSPNEENLAKPAEIQPDEELSTSDETALDIGDQKPNAEPLIISPKHEDADKDAEDEETIVSFSWKVLNKLTAVKIIDKTCLKDNMSPIPLDIGWFFNSDKLELDDMAALETPYDGKIYYSTLFSKPRKYNGNTVGRKLLIKWSHRLNPFVRDCFNRRNDCSPAISFEKTDKDREYLFNLGYLSSDNSFTIYNPNGEPAKSDQNDTKFHVKPAIIASQEHREKTERTHFRGIKEETAAEITTSESEEQISSDAPKNPDSDAGIIIHTDTYSHQNTDVSGSAEQREDTDDFTDSQIKEEIPEEICISNSPTKSNDLTSDIYESQENVSAGSVNIPISNDISQNLENTPWECDDSRIDRDRVDIYRVDRDKSGVVNPNPNLEEDYIDWLNSPMCYSSSLFGEYDVPNEEIYDNDSPSLYNLMLYDKMEDLGLNPYEVFSNDNLYYNSYYDSPFYLHQANLNYQYNHKSDLQKKKKRRVTTKTTQSNTRILPTGGILITRVSGSEIRESHSGYTSRKQNRYRKEATYYHEDELAISSQDIYEFEEDPEELITRIRAECRNETKPIVIIRRKST